MFGGGTTVHGGTKHDSTVTKLTVHAVGTNFVDGTIYQNVSGRTLIVTMQCLSAGTWTLNVDDVTPPVNVCGTGVNGENLCFAVPNLYYYRITGGTSQYVYEVY